MSLDGGHFSRQISPGTRSRKRRTSTYPGVGRAYLVVPFVFGVVYRKDAPLVFLAHCTYGTDTRVWENYEGFRLADSSLEAQERACPDGKMPSTPVSREPLEHGSVWRPFYLFTSRWWFTGTHLEDS